ncbi:hypothetical protein JZU46_00855 [bacterium]|nr:hypothetical protein [bacterium]
MDVFLIVYDTKKIFLYTDNVEEPLASSFGPIVVLNRANTNKDLLLHELTHIRQFYSYGLAVQALAYQFSQKFRVLFEYEAYSAEETKLSTAEFVDYMHKYYNISLTDEEILRIIKVLN